jgi:hypothetical protein
LNQVVVSIPDHITVHQREQSVAAHVEVLESSTFPKDGHAKEGISDEKRDHGDQGSRDERSRLDETCKHGFVGFCLEEVPKHGPPGQHAAETKQGVCNLDVEVTSEDVVCAANYLRQVGNDRDDSPNIKELDLVPENELVPVGLLHKPQLLGFGVVVQKIVLVNVLILVDLLVERLVRLDALELRLLALVLLVLILELFQLLLVINVCHVSWCNPVAVVELTFELVYDFSSFYYVLELDDQGSESHNNGEY